MFSHTTPETDQRLRVVCEGPSLPKYHVSDTVIKMSHLKTLSCSSKTGSLKRSSASSQGFGASGVMAMAGVSLTDYRVSPVVSTVTAEFGASKSGVVPGPLMRNGGGRLYSTTKRGSMSGLPPLPPQLPPPMAQGPDDVSSPTEGR